MLYSRHDSTRERETDTLSNHAMNAKEKQGFSPELAQTHDPSNQVVCRLGDTSCANAHASKLPCASGSHSYRGTQSVLNLQRNYGNRFVGRVLKLAKKRDREKELDFHEIESSRTITAAARQTIQGTEMAREIDQGNQVAKSVTETIDSGPLKIPRQSFKSDSRTKPQLAFLRRGLQLARMEQKSSAVDLLQRSIDLFGKDPEHPLLHRPITLAPLYKGIPRSIGGGALSSGNCSACKAGRLQQQNITPPKIQNDVLSRETLARDGGAGGERSFWQCLNHALSSAGIPWAVITIIGSVCAVLGGIAGLAGGPAAPATAPSGAAVAAAVCVAGVCGLSVGFVLGVIMNCIRAPQGEWRFAQTEGGGAQHAGGETETAPA